MTELNRVMSELQRLLGLNVVCGSITLNVNESELQSVKTEIYQRIATKAVDRRDLSRST